MDRMRRLGRAWLGVAGLLCLLRADDVWAQPVLPGSAEPPLAGVPTAPVTPPGPPAVPNTPLPRDLSDPPAPMVTLRVRVPGQASAGEPLKYHLFVENAAQAPAHHVLVRDRLPANVEFLRATPEPKKQGQDLLWDLGTLGPSARKEIVVEVRPDGSGDVENNAFVQYEHGQTVRTRLVRPGLRLKVTAPPFVRYPDPVPFQIEVTNPGPAAVTDIVVTDLLPADLKFANSKPATTGENPLTWKLGTLAPGESRRVQFDAIAPQPGKFRDRVEVTAAGGVRLEGHAEVTVGEPKFTVIKTGPARRTVGRTANYRITVHNQGAVPLTGVQITDWLAPRGVKFLRADGGGQLVGNEVRWRVAELKPGERKTVQVEFQANEPGRLLNRAQATADGGLKAGPSEAATEFEAARGPAVEIDRGDDPLEVGRHSTYHVRVYNPTAASVSGVTLTFSVLNELKILDARGMTAGKIAGTVVQFEPLLTLAGGASAEYTVDVEAVKAGPTRLRADLLSAGGTVPWTWEETLTVLPASR
jgi:uncharacterized repeat protein (TIGR01451 family)